MGILATTAYLTRLRDIRAAKRPNSAVDVVPEPNTDAGQQITHLLAVGEALRANMAVVTRLLLDPADDGDAIAKATAQADALKRSKNPRGVPPIRLQPRDLDMLHTLAEARLLTAIELEWLHFPTWRARYKRVLVQRRTNPHIHYRVVPHLYERLNALVGAGYLQRIARTTPYVRTHYVRLPNIYMLTEAGADLLVTMRDMDADEVWTEDVRRRAVQNLDHSLEIAQLYAALRCTVAHVGNATLTEWQGDHLLARPQTYDRLFVRGYSDPLPVQPDGTCVLTIEGQPTRIFVELDRGTRPLTTWAAKIAAYHTYQQSLQLQARYGTDRFVLLIIAPMQTRLARIAEEIITHTRTPDPAYLLTTADQVHPGTIRTQWQQIGAVTWEQRRFPQGFVEVPEITLKVLPLWKNVSPVCIAYLIVLSYTLRLHGWV